MEASKKIKIYGTLVNHTLDRTLSDNTHNDVLAYAYQLYDDRFEATPVQENFLDNINKRVTTITYDNNVTVIENRDHSKGNPYMLIIKGHTNIEGDLHVDNIYIRDKMSIEGDLEVKGDTRLRGDLWVDGDTNLRGKLDVYGDTHLHEDLQVDGDTNIGGDLNVFGDTHLHENLQVDGDTNIGGDLTVEGDTNIHGDLHVDGDVYAPNILKLEETVNNLQQTINKLKGYWDLSDGYLVSTYPTKAPGYYDTSI